MGSVTSSIPAESIFATAAVVGALGYGYVHYSRPAARSDGADTHPDASASALSTRHGQKKSARKLQLPGDATLKNLDILDAPSRSASTSSASGTRQRRRQPQREAPSAQSQDAVPGGFDGAITSVDDARDLPEQQSQPLQQQQQHVAAAAKKPKKKKGKKAAASEPSSASGTGASPLATSSMSMDGAVQSEAAPVGKGKRASAPASAAVADARDEPWTRVEARKKKASVQDGLASSASADVVTSDAGITTSVTGTSSPVTERTTEDELPSELDESRLEMSAVSLQDAPLRVAPVRPPPGEQPAKGFKWEDYEGMQVDEDASGEDDGGWGVVRSRRKPNKAASDEGGGSTTAAASQPQPQTKKQRQNAQRREALKDAKREREAQQQAAFALHKRELRAAEHVAAPKRTGSRYDSLGDS